MGEYVVDPENTTPFAELLRTVSGAAPGESVQVVTPTFERPSNLPPPMIPPTDARGWETFRHCPAEDLRAWGLLPWGAFTRELPAITAQSRAVADRLTRLHHRLGFPETEQPAPTFYPLEDESDGRTATHVLWLLPGAWYASIPEGFPLIDINGRAKPFIPGQTDDDIRYGCLAYGIMIPKA